VLTLHQRSNNIWYLRIAFLQLDIDGNSNFPCLLVTLRLAGKRVQPVQPQAHPTQKHRENFKTWFDISEIEEYIATTIYFQ
jgi:hypothetical protein